MKKLLLFLLASFLMQMGFTQDWILKDELKPDDLILSDDFGYIKFQNDNFLVVRSCYADYDNGTVEVSNAGAVYIYGKSVSGKWYLSQKLFAPAGFIREYSAFGGAVCMVNDLLFISDINSGYNQTPGSGSVFLFRMAEDGRFDFEKRIGSSSPHENKHFGSALAVNENFLFVGASGDAFDENGEVERKDAGSVELFKRDSEDNWVFFDRWVAPSRGEGHLFGKVLSLSGNGIAISESGYIYPDGDNGPIRLGCVHYYEYTLQQLNRKWAYKKTINNPNKREEGRFGRAIALDGSNLAVGNPDASFDVNGENPKEHAGLVYVYKKNSILGNWIRQALFDGIHRCEFGEFGSRLDLSGDFLVVGYHQDPANSGSVIIFSCKSGEWNHFQKLRSSNMGSLSGFGFPSLHNGSLLVGDTGYISLHGGCDTGSVFCYEYEPATGSFEIMLDNELTVYPNPAKNFITVNLGNIETAELTIHSITGAEVMRKQVSSASCQLDVSKLNSGMYILTANSSKGKSSQRILIK